MLQIGTTPDGRLAVRGELDLLTVPALEDMLAGLDGAAEIDLSGVTFFDSSALRAVLAARRGNRRLRVINPSESVAKVLELTGTFDYLVFGREITW